MSPELINICRDSFLNVKIFKPDPWELYHLFLIHTEELLREILRMSRGSELFKGAGLDGNTKIIIVNQYEDNRNKGYKERIGKN